MKLFYKKIRSLSKMRKNGLIFVFVKICGRCFLIHFIKWGGVIFLSKISHTENSPAVIFKKTPDLTSQIFILLFIPPY